MSRIGIARKTRLTAWLKLSFEVWLKEWIVLVLLCLLPFSIAVTDSIHSKVFTSCKSLTFYASVPIHIKFLIMDLRLKKLQFLPTLSVCPVAFLFLVLPGLTVIFLIASDLSFFGAALLILQSLPPRDAGSYSLQLLLRSENEISVLCGDCLGHSLGRSLA